MTDSVKLEEIDSKYGGLDGPDAMYVKLLSSDGHEFIVKREHALTSGTIKAMLSGPGTRGTESDRSTVVTYLSACNSCFVFFIGQFQENEANEINFKEIP